MKLSERIKSELGFEIEVVNEIIEEIEIDFSIIEGYIRLHYAMWDTIMENNLINKGEFFLRNKRLRVPKSQCYLCALARIIRSRYKEDEITFSCDVCLINNLNICTEGLTHWKREGDIEKRKAHAKSIRDLRNVDLTL